MKTTHKKKALLFGDVIASVYDACGKQKARGVIRLAVNTHLLVFCGHKRYVIS